MPGDHDSDGIVITIGESFDVQEVHDLCFRSHGLLTTVGKIDAIRHSVKPSGGYHVISPPSFPSSTNHSHNDNSSGHGSASVLSEVQRHPSFENTRGPYFDPTYALPRPPPHNGMAVDSGALVDQMSSFYSCLAQTQAQAQLQMRMPLSVNAPAQLPLLSTFRSSSQPMDRAGPVSMPPHLVHDMEGENGHPMQPLLGPPPLQPILQSHPPQHSPTVLTQHLQQQQQKQQQRRRKRQQRPRKQHFSVAMSTYEQLFS